MGRRLSSPDAALLPFSVEPVAYPFQLRTADSRTYGEKASYDHPPQLNLWLQI